jgi:putative ABC transport system permease protein
MIKRIVFKNIIRDKAKSSLIISTIFIATFLITIISIVGTSIVDINKQNILSSNMNYHMRVIDANYEQIAEFSKDKNVEALMVSTNFAKIYDERTNVYLVYNENLVDEVTELSYIQGSYPISENEISGTKFLFEAFDVEAKIGEKINIPFRINNEGKVIEKEFVISGVFDNKVDDGTDYKLSRGSYSFMVSRKLVMSNSENNINGFTAFIRLRNSGNYNELNENIELLANKHNIESDDVFKNIEYMKVISDSTYQTKLAKGLISILLVLFSGLVLYSVYSALLFLNIQNVGRLRILGANINQVKKILYIENGILSLIGIISGLIIGQLIAYICVKYLYANYSLLEFDYKGLPILTVKIFITMILATFVCTQPVVKRMIKFSPIEAFSYRVEEVKLLKRRASHRKISIATLAKIDLKQNIKNIKISVIVMAVSGALFIASTGLLSSVDVNSIVKDTIFYGDFQVSLNYSVDDKEYPANNLNIRQKNNEIDVYLNEIKDIQGVSKIKEIYLSLGNVLYKDTLFDEKRVAIGTFDEFDVHELQRELELGDIDYDTIVKENGIIYAYGHAFEKNGFEIGDEFVVEFLVDDEKVPVNVKLLASTNSLGYGTFLIAEKTMKEIFGESSALYGISVYSSDNQYNQTKQRLYELTKDKSNISLYSRDEEIQYANKTLATIKYPILILCVIIGMIALITIINTMVISIIRRLKEIELYRCIGMTKRQLFLMLSINISFIVASAFVISIAVGNLLGYALVSYAKSNYWIGIVSYNIPAMSILTLAMTQILMTLLLTILMIRFIYRNKLDIKL